MGQGLKRRLRVSETSFNYFEQLREAAIKPGSEHLDTFILPAVVNVLNARANFTVEELQGMDGLVLFTKLSDIGDYGVLGKEFLSNAEFEIDGDVAIVKGVGADKHFAREDGWWRIDIGACERAQHEHLESTKWEGAETSTQRAIAWAHSESLRPSSDIDLSDYLAGARTESKLVEYEDSPEQAEARTALEAFTRTMRRGDAETLATQFCGHANDWGAAFLRLALDERDDRLAVVARERPLLVAMALCLRHLFDARELAAMSPERALAELIVRGCIVGTDAMWGYGPGRITLSEDGKKMTASDAFFGMGDFRGERGNDGVWRFNVTQHLNTAADILKNMEMTNPRVLWSFLEDATPDPELVSEDIIYGPRPAVINRAGAGEETK